MPTGLLAPRSVEELLSGLRAPEEAALGPSGYRSTSVEDALRRARAAAPLCGVTRVADLCGIDVASIAVAQATRPDPLFHTESGANTGAQGKGPELSTAQLSALMEAIEGFSAEPQRPHLIRASAEFLREAGHIVHADSLARCTESAPFDESEALMWTPAASLFAGQRVLVPAEAVYYPFFPEDFATRPTYPNSSSGLGAGSSYLEASIRAIYELIERHVVRALELGLAPTVAVEPTAEWAARAAPHALTVLLTWLPGGPRLPTFFSVVRDGSEHYVGTATHLSGRVAAEQSVAEALQSAATHKSGAREDVVVSHATSGAQPAEPSRSVSFAEVEVHFPPAPPRLSLAEELDRLRVAAVELGAIDVLLANLTRVGIEVPVVRALGPGLLTPAAARAKHGTSRRMWLRAWSAHGQG